MEVRVTSGERVERQEQYFERILTICNDLKDRKNYLINPQLIQSVEAGIAFCDLMINGLSVADQPEEARTACRKVSEQIDFLNGGGSMVEYDTQKIRGELHDVFFEKLRGLYQKMNCAAAVGPPDKA